MYIYFLIFLFGGFHTTFDWMHLGIAGPEPRPQLTAHRHSKPPSMPGNCQSCNAQKKPQKKKIFVRQRKSKQINKKSGKKIRVNNKKNAAKTQQMPKRKYIALCGAKPPFWTPLLAHPLTHIAHFALQLRRQLLCRGIVISARCPALRWLQSFSSAFWWATTPPLRPAPGRYTRFLFRLKQGGMKLQNC